MVKSWKDIKDKRTKEKTWDEVKVSRGYEPPPLPEFTQGLKQIPNYDEIFSGKEVQHQPEVNISDKKIPAFTQGLNQIPNYDETFKLNDVNTPVALPGELEIVEPQKIEETKKSILDYMPTVKMFIDDTIHAWTQPEPQYVYNKVMSGVGQANTGAYNLINLGTEAFWTGNDLFAKGLQTIGVPDQYAPVGIRGPINKMTQDIVDFNQQGSQYHEKNASELEGEVGPVTKFVGAGSQALPQVGMAAASGAGVYGMAPQLGKLAALLPFGGIAGGNYALEAENEGANLAQQIAYGAAGGATEMVTEAIPFDNAMKLLKSIGADELVEQGAKSLIKKYGKMGVQLLTNIAAETAQEVVVTPMTQTAKKAIYDKDIPLTGDNGIIDFSQMTEDAYGGLAMSVMLAAFGLPTASRANKKANAMMESKELTPENIQELYDLVKEESEQLAVTEELDQQEAQQPKIEEQVLIDKAQEEIQESEKSWKDIVEERQVTPEVEREVVEEETETEEEIGLERDDEESMEIEIELPDVDEIIKNLDEAPLQKKPNATKSEEALKIDIEGSNITADKDLLDVFPEIEVREVEEALSSPDAISEREDYLKAREYGLDHDKSLSFMKYKQGNIDKQTFNETLKGNEKINSELKKESEVIESKISLPPHTIQKQLDPKTNGDIWVVKPDKKIEYKSFKGIDQQIREQGGSYSNALNGFVFTKDPSKLIEKQEISKEQALEFDHGKRTTESINAKDGEVKKEIPQSQQKKKEEKKGKRDKKTIEKMDGKSGEDSSKGGKDTNNSDTFKYESDELEQQHAENRLTKVAFKDKLNEWTEEFKKRATRTFKDMDPKLVKNAEAIKELILYPKLKGITGDDASRIIHDIINNEEKGLTPEEYNKFERLVFLNDLREEIELKHSLPGKWTEKNVQKEYDRLNKVVNENILAAVERRQQHWSNTIKEYTKAMKGLGFNVEDRFNKKNYFRHQVLEYANAKITGSGSRIKGNKNRGWSKQRHGSQKAINEDYLQAEYEVLSNMLYDTKVAEMLKRIENNYSIKDKLKKQAKKANKEALNIIIQAEKKENKKAMEVQPDFEGGTQDAFSETEEAIKLFGKNIAMAFSELSRVASKGELWDGQGKYVDEVKQLSKGHPTKQTNNIDMGNRTFKYLAELAKQEDVKGVVQARVILKNVSKKKKFIREALGDEYKTYEDFIPEDHKQWQPIPGRYFLTVNTVSERFAEAMVTMEFEKLGVSDLQIREMTAIGKERDHFVIPDYLADTLDDVYSNANKDDSPWGKAISKSLNLWKGWVLTGNPRQVIKYNLRNITGDFDGLIASAGFKAANPKYINKAAKEIYDAMKYLKFSNELLEWRDRGGFQTLLYANEIADVGELQVFRKYSTAKEVKSFYKKIIERIPLANSYTEFTRNMTDYREAILRYSTYLFYKENIQKNSGSPEFYGASNANMIKGLKSTQDKAYQLSKDALGSYDEITEFGQALRKYWIPFWSWNEVNFKRYKRIMENAVADVRIQNTVGTKMAKSLNIPLKIGPRAIKMFGKLGIRVMFLSAILKAWNKLVMNDEDEELPESIRNSPHITLGRNSKGEIVYFSRLGSMNDLMEWVGLDTFATDIQELINGRKTAGEQASDMLMSPVNKVVGAINPFVKMPMELFAKKSTYPDVRQASTIRDPYYYIAQSLGFKEEYKRAKGLPVNESYLESWMNAFVYTSKPEVNAYYRVLDLKRKFEKDVLGKYPSQAFNDSPKSQSLYYFKLALKYGDKDKSKKFLKEYLSNGGTPDGISKSLSTLSPVYGLKTNELTAFYEWLSYDEQKDLEKAYRYYMSLVGGE